MGRSKTPWRRSNARARPVNTAVAAKPTPPAARDAVRLTVFGVAPYLPLDRHLSFCDHQSFARYSRVGSQRVAATVAPASRHRLPIAEPTTPILFAIKRAIAILITHGHSTRFDERYGVAAAHAI